jgi:Fe-S-cluster containining protein
VKTGEIEARLCTGCGLCCNGSLFADVELANRREANALEAMGLDVDHDEAILSQPCAALDGKRCSVYQFRPGCCRTFECRLLQRVKAGLISVREAEAKISEALAQVQRIETLLPRTADERLSLKERCQDAPADGELALKARRFETFVRRVFL